MTLPIGTELGGYVLAGVLGSGASGTVYRARDADGLPVALKLLHNSSAGDTASRRRLRREVRAQRAIRSPFVAQVVDAELDGAEAFIVTELVEGISLARDLSANGPWEPDQVAELARDLDQALDAVHHAGVLHRDIKPSNVVLDKRGRPVLIDFGIAQDRGAGRITAAGLVAGTPGFVSPELLRGGDPTPASDRWAAAALLLNAATGNQPFGTGTVEAVLARVLDGLPDTDGLPDGIAHAFRRALTPDSERRLSLLELAEAIDPSAAPDTLSDPTAPLVRPDPIPEDPLTAWTKPMRPPWTEPRRVDYRTWLEDTREDNDQAADAAVPVQPYPPAPAPLRLLTLGLWALLGVLATHWPVAVASTAAAAMVLARTIWVAAEAVTARRYRRGPRPSDRTRTVLAAPWYFLRGLGGALPSLALGGLVGWGGYLLAVHLGGVGQGGDPSAAGAQAAASSIALAGGLVLAWWGPSGQETRDGERLVLRGLLGTPWARWAATVAVWAATGVAAAIWFG
ncbi:MAG: serine/threonine protein kinase [Bifidobacteriaceae bacterium]|nr:serine/threonine protein kinase [Bifidobacteriaceae bacterium]